MSDKFFIDTNILVYAHDAENSQKQQKAQSVIVEGIRLDKENKLLGCAHPGLRQTGSMPKNFFRRL